MQNKEFRKAGVLLGYARAFWTGRDALLRVQADQQVGPTQVHGKIAKQRDKEGRKALGFMASLSFSKNERVQKDWFMTSTLNFRKCLAACVGALLLVKCVVPCQGELSITVGDILLQPYVANQTYDLIVENLGSAAVPVGGLQLNIEITVPEGQSDTHPVISDVDILVGTIFEFDNSGLFGGMVTDYKWEIGTIPNFDDIIPMVDANSSAKVATITFDASLVDPGFWNFSVTTGAGPTTYTDADTGLPLAMTLNDGTVTALDMVPEIPQGALVAGLLLLALGAGRSWRLRNADPGKRSWMLDSTEGNKENEDREGRVGDR